MHLVESKETKDRRASRLRPAMEVYLPRSNDPGTAAPIRVRKGQHLDVDGILARSLPNLGTFSPAIVKTMVSR